ncbi:hypothetical protein CAN33_0054725 [Aspergillus niger]|uniref:Uncharacterized protein n=1 Tax=Aspergillus niger TaxID=5061 RepID=A0A505IGP3_ASPNG|nr:hypothetical protein CAN33_0054725 [Aspergillus niger]
MNPTHAVSSILPPEAILERLLPGHEFLLQGHDRGPPSSLICISSEPLYRDFCEDVDQAGVENRSASSTSIQCKAASDDDETKCLDLPKRTESAEGGITLSDLLNVIDGISAREGRILIMTTNKPEDLDEALKRPGRVDLQIRFDFVNTHAAKELFLIPYVECPTEDFIVDPETMEIRCSLKPVIKDLTLERLAGLADSFARKITVGKYSSAQLQGYLMRFKGDPVSAERHVEDWMQRMDTEKAGDMLPSFSGC